MTIIKTKIVATPKHIYIVSNKDNSFGFQTITCDFMEE